MAALEYDNFDLLIETEVNGEFRARVLDSPTGERPTSRFTIPVEPTQLENLLLKLDPGRSGTRRVAADPASQAALELGSALFEAVFSSDIRLTWARGLDTVRSARRGMRLRLRLTEAPSIAVLPWELLHDRRQNSYLAQSERTPVVRYLEVPLTPRPLDLDGALRILVVVSSPTDLPELDVEAEWRRVENALADRVGQGTVRLDRLEKPTLHALSSWLRRHDVHVLHFIGHGEYDRRLEDGVVYFADGYGRRMPVPSGVLGPYLRDHDPLRLVFLNACQTARVDSTDPFSGLAQGLVQQDCVAVVAMQFPISDRAAAEFTGEFYGSLADGMAVDQAVTSGRKALLAEYASEWATPVLFLRDPDGRVFDHIVPSNAALAAEPTAPRPATGPDTERPAARDLASNRSGIARTPRPNRITGRLLAAVVVLALVGWLGWWLVNRPGDGDGTVTPASSTSSTGQVTTTAAPVVVARQVNVPGNVLWTDTNLQCRAGDRLEISGSGKVLHNTADPNSGVDPSGLTDPSYHQYNVPGLPDANTVALIGSIDRDKPFLVGLATTLTCDRAGELFLGVNDVGVFNNSGQFVAKVTLTAGSRA